MKNLFLFIGLIFTIHNSTAQNDNDVIEQNLLYNKFATSFTTTVIGANEDFVMYYWQVFIERHKGTSYVITMKEGNLELESKHVEFPLLNNELVTIHARFSPNSTDSGVLLTIWIERKDGTYYSSKIDKDSGIKIKKWLLGFHQELMELSRIH